MAMSVVFVENYYKQDKEKVMKVKTVDIAEKLDKEQTETISNIIHDVLVDLGYGENLDFYAWDLKVDIEKE